MSKNKLYILIILFPLFTFIFVSKTISFFMTSAEGEEINLKMAEWHPAESQVSIYKNDNQYSVEENIDTENTNNFQQNFVTEENQYLSFQYKINSTENTLGFDEPNFLVKLNEEIVFQDNVIDGVWNRGFINLKNYKSNGNNYYVEFISSNTFDDEHSPNLELKDISTTRYLAKENDLLRFSVTKPNSKINLKYIVEEVGILVEKEHVILEPYEFLITEHFYNNEIEYYSIDAFGNIEDSKYLIIDTDFSPPSKIVNLKFFPEGDNELSATFDSPIDSFSRSSLMFEVTSTNHETSSAPTNHKKFGTSSLSSSAGSIENILIKNLAPGINNFAIKSIDQAENYSEISKTIETTIY